MSDYAGLEISNPFNLKGSLTAYKGHFTRLYNEIAELLSGDNADTAIRTKMDSLSRIYESYQEKSHDYLEILDPTTHEYAKVAEDNQRITQRYLEMNRRVDNRLLLPRASTVEGQRVQKDILHGRSQVSESTEYRLALLEVTHLEEDQRLLEKRYNIQSKQYDLELERLEIERKVLQAKRDADKAEILANSSRSSGQQSSRNLRQIPKQTTAEKVKKYLDSYDAQSEINNNDDIWPRPPLTRKSYTETPYTATKKEKDEIMQRNEVENNNTAQLYLLLEQQQKAIQMLATGLEKLDMPKKEFLTFDGNPTRYHRFIKNFEVNIERKITDDNIRLSYLIQYCTGSAREAIENCVIQPAEIGYREAKEILHKNFGQPHIIIRAFINKVVQGPQLKPSEPDKLLQLARDMRNCYLNSDQMGYKSDINAMETLKKIVKRLPPHLQAKWADESGKLIESGGDPLFKHLTEFVEKRAACANTEFGKLVGTKPDEDLKIKDSKLKMKKKPEIKPGNVASSFAVQSQISKEQDPKPKGNSAESTKCLFCDQENHELIKCFKFRRKPFKERKEFTRSKKLCDNCLKEGHNAFRCNNLGACLVSECGKRHHSLLHPPNEDVKPAAVNEAGNASNNAQSPPSGQAHCGATHTGNRRVSLRIVPVRVVGKDGHELETYAFLDNGSDSSLCLKRFADALGHTGKPTEFTLSTINAERQVKSAMEFNMQVKALDSDEEIHLDCVRTVDHLPVAVTIPDSKDLKELPYLQGIEFPRIPNGQVSILIGNDTPEAHWILEQRRGEPKQPYAVRTPLGWTLIGPMGSQSNQPHINFISEDYDLIAKQLEEIYNHDFNDLSTQTRSSMSKEDERALNIMQSTVRLIDGHYQLGLPWKHKTPCLPNNRSVAERRLHFLKRRLQGNEELLKNYKNTVEEYIELGHARKLPVTSLLTKESQVWYLPHHPVFHPQKPDKTRVVFDCASTFKGTSLNSQLLQGPELTSTLVGVLLRFRLDNIAFIADIEKMFHQVRVIPQDCEYLRFLWWPEGDISKQPDEYQMLVHLFGASSSPSCANFALRRTAEDNRDSFDLQTIDTVFRNFYVDDCLRSVATPEEAIKLTTDLSALLSKGGFHLTKFISNSREVMATIPEEERAKSVKNLDLEKLPIDRALGMHWNIEEDEISFRIAEPREVNTRRKVLSLVSSIYDPLGLACPLVLPAKNFLQDLTKDGYDWDDEISIEELDFLMKWMDDTPKLNNISVPRCIKPYTFGDLVSIQIHNFSDASEDGYGAASYLRLTDIHGNINCTLLLGKSRVAPIKTISIPRLELTAATVAVRLNAQIQEEMDLPVHRAIFWTDSTIVLQYIRNRSRRFSTFVANRIATIHEHSSPSQWRHVESSLNPADYASRGIKPNESNKIERWLKGPQFLSIDEEFWPKQPDQLPEIQDDDDEVKKEKVRSYAIVQTSPLTKLIQYYSSWFKLQKAIAWLLRYVKYLKSRAGKIPAEQLQRGYLKIPEIVQATKIIVKHVQRQHFQRDIDALMQKESSESTYNSPLKKLNPVLIDGIICVGGRLQRSSFAHAVKHPIILPSDDVTTDMIINHYHNQEGHVGASQVLAVIRQKFWILKGPATVKRAVKKCITCQRCNARTGEQLMAPLPEARVTPYKPPFSAVGVDYFGPIYVKIKRSHAKRYGCVFTCLATRGVHIEVSHDLTTDSFIQAFTRFVSRRGPPTQVFSDNGTNFKGAEIDIKYALEKWNQTQIANHCLQSGIQWNFNAPSASHSGGIWERMIRSIRKILRCLLGNQVVDDETLLTVLAEVEKVLNDRPLTKQLDDVNDLQPLTPNMLLLNRANHSYSPGGFTERDRYTKHWRYAQYLADMFWKRWIKEYIPLLQERQKWHTKRRNLEVGDLVLIVDDNLPRGHWHMGVVHETLPDKFGDVRQAWVRTSTNKLLRDVRKLCLLEGQFEQE